MRRTVTLIATTATFLALAVPVLAGNAVGDRLSLFGGPVPSAGEPFHVSHGFGFTPGGDDFPGNWDFILVVDGVAVADSGVIHTLGSSTPMDLRRLYNFPDGMSGTHHFEGFWYESCQSPAATCDPGDPPGSLTQTFYLERWVTFP